MSEVVEPIKALVQAAKIARLYTKSASANIEVQHPLLAKRVLKKFEL